MEPWDGPASIAFTDGTVVGATLDRNGLRPARYWVTADGRVVMASETGVLDIAPREVVAKGRLEPGRMFLVDTAAGRIVPDDELKESLAAEQPYAEWIGRSMIRLPDLPAPRPAIEPDHATVLRRQEAFGYTTEEIRMIVTPMAVDGRRADRLDGRRRPARRPLRPAAAPSRLLHPALRPGHEPAARRDPRGDRHRGRDGDRARRRTSWSPDPAGARQLALPSPVLPQRGARAAARARRRRGRARLPERDPADPLPGGRGRARPAAGDRGRPRARRRGDRRGLRPRHPVRPGSRRGPRPDPGPPRRRGRPPPPPAGRDADPRRARAGVRRAARGPPRRHAHRLRGERGQPVPGVRDDRRPRPRGDDRRAGRGRRTAVRQGDHEGRREGRLEDGDLGDLGLSRGPGLRGAGPFAGLRRRVLHGHADAHRRDRDRPRRRRGPAPPRPGPPGHGARTG